MKGSSALPYRGGWLSRTQTVEELRRSFSLQLQRPLILVVVIGGALVQFAIETWAGMPPPVPADLAGMFAPPPLDSFSWIYSGLGILPLGMLGVVRLVGMWLFVCLVLRIVPGKENLLRTSGVYLMSVFAFGLLLAALVWVGPLLAARAARLLGGSVEGDSSFAQARLALGMTYLLVFIPLLIVAAVVISPLLGRAAAGQALKVRLHQRCVWALASLSAVLYVLVAIGGKETAVSAASFLRAFVVLWLQSLIFGAIVHTTAGSAALRTLRS